MCMLLLGCCLALGLRVFRSFEDLLDLLGGDWLHVDWAVSMSGGG